MKIYSPSCFPKSETELVSILFSLPKLVNKFVDDENIAKTLGILVIVFITTSKSPIIFPDLFPIPLKNFAPWAIELPRPATPSFLVTDPLVS